jgi:catechol 2,3-dioxygenase-like lactoylglutathione lyase family enzyme
MSDPSPINDQLILELYTRNISASVDFYQRFGFRLLRAEPHFVELGWDQAQIYLEEVTDGPPPQPGLTKEGKEGSGQAPHGGQTVGNVRVLVPDVDRYWTLAQELGCTVIRPIENRYYGLRDFTIAGPDGIGLRFATRLA